MLLFGFRKQSLWVCDCEWFERKLGSDFENGLFIFQSLQDREENTTKFVNNK